ncbi:hypothetical protein [Glaciihabitans sp. dw_435]|uniref:hypothetical protein n=1 Tax=Glaciihabitans sp. dw_435 TaxID=2720081 RepID=UPI001BD26EB5|nr:hypothetical protein [Glaciihabitans sp. dw_435]
MTDSTTTPSDPDDAVTGDSDSEAESPEQSDDGMVGLGSTASGSGTSLGGGNMDDARPDVDPAEYGTTEADVSDGRDQ